MVAVWLLNQQSVECATYTASHLSGFRHLRFVVVALWNRADHYIFILSFVLLLSFLRLISATADWMSVILPHMVWP